MAIHHFVEYSRIFKKHSIPLGLRPSSMICGNSLLRKINQTLFAARSVDTMIQRKVRTPGCDGVGIKDITKIIVGPGTRGAGKRSMETRRLAKTRELPILPVPPFQGRPIKDFQDLVEGMQNAIRTGEYKADFLLPRGWDQRWYATRQRKAAAAANEAFNNEQQLTQLDIDEHNILDHASALHEIQNSQLDTELDENEIIDYDEPDYYQNEPLAAQHTALLKENDDNSKLVPGYGDESYQFKTKSWEERPYLGVSTMYDRCMDQYCFDLIMATLPLDYLYEAGNHNLPLRSIRTAHMAIAKHVEGMQADLLATQSFTSSAGSVASPQIPIPVLLEIDMLRLRDHVPREKIIQLFTESSTSFYGTTLSRNLINVISSLVHRQVKGDVLPRRLGLAPNNTLSNLLSNVYLYPLDAFLISRGYRIVRYLDRIALVLPSMESAIHISRDIVFFAEGELGVPASLHRTQLVEPGQRGNILMHDVEINPATGKYHYYIPEPQASRLDKLAKQLFTLLHDASAHRESKEVDQCVRQILGCIIIYTTADSTFPSVSRISKLYRQGRMTKDGIIDEILAWKSIPGTG